MAYLFSFEKLEVWKLSMDLAETVYSLGRSFPQEEKFGLISQSRRAAVSISSNLAEGSSRVSFKDQAKFSSIAYSSLMELMSQMMLANRFGWIEDKQFQNFRLKAEKLANKINGLRNSQINRIGEPEVEYQLSKTASEVPPYDSTNQQINKSTPLFIHPTALIDNGADIGNGSKIWHFSHIMSGATIGRNCNIGQNVFIASGVTLGNNVKVQNNVSIYEGVACEDDVFLGPSMVFTNVVNPRSAVNRKAQYKATKVGKGASIGANATIICGNQIGQYAFVGAGAVVTKEVLDFALVVGNPAQQTGWMSVRGHRLEFDESGEAVCPEGGESYVLLDGKVEELKGEKGEQDEGGGLHRTMKQ